MRRILLVRHGETAWNAAGRLLGSTDQPLTDVGRDQARALAGRLGDAELVGVWTSALGRARETGAIVAEVLGLPAPEVDEELREREFGVFEGLTREDCETQYPAAWRDWKTQTGTPPGGETRAAATARLGRALARIATGDGGAVAVISHGAVMRLWLMEVLGTSIPIVANGATFVVEHDRGAIRVAPRPADGRRPADAR